MQGLLLDKIPLNLAKIKSTYPNLKKTKNKNPAELLDRATGNLPQIFRIHRNLSSLSMSLLYLELETCNNCDPRDNIITTYSCLIWYPGSSACKKIRTGPWCCHIIRFCSVTTVCASSCNKQNHIRSALFGKVWTQVAKCTWKNEPGLRYRFNLINLPFNPIVKSRCVINRLIPNTDYKGDDRTQIKRNSTTNYQNW